MDKLILIGGGGHCRSVLDSALAMDIFEEIVIIDARLEVGSTVLGCRVAGTDSDLSKLKELGFTYAFVTVGSIESANLRKKLSAVAGNLGFQFPVICDPTACVSKFASVAEGTFIGKHAVINADAEIGKHCIINTGSIIEHECTVGDYSHLSVGSILCGNSHVGIESFVGAGSTVIQGISIGDHTIIGANSTILSNVEDNMKVYGITAGRGGISLTLLRMPSFWDLYLEVA